MGDRISWKERVRELRPSVGATALYAKDTFRERRGVVLAVVDSVCVRGRWAAVVEWTDTDRYSRTIEVFEPEALRVGLLTIESVPESKPIE